MIMHLLINLKLKFQKMTCHINIDDIVCVYKEYYKNYSIIKIIDKIDYIIDGNYYNIRIFAAKHKYDRNWTILRRKINDVLNINDCKIIKKYSKEELLIKFPELILI